MYYSISQFSVLTGFSVHTLRFYEKAGILAPLRLENNHRSYSARDVEWITFITRLKETGMPLKEIKYYADLRAQGDETAQARILLLQQHNEILRQRIAALNESVQHLDKKISYYNRLLNPETT
ncbi:MerR family transcriptional regulator [Morganella psychrotolerans]|uniref:MerR family transcriptional regulator n=1 Tax=Morganella psychrotolerans TaxID=368603 RepID=A0A1B8HUZ4_9GAMM|nr:MerR family transcriptional regulator [Morganella psychrotolerans]OBU13601.1 MerR family transcriptional regulator [Morganella psychrotolerans]